MTDKQLSEPTVAIPKPHNAYATSKVNFWEILRIWLLIGVQSFGGGSATMFLIRREHITKRNWLTEDDVNEFWALCQLTPGMSIIALSILIGRKLKGWKGIVAVLTGLLFPSVIITTILAAGFNAVGSLAPAQAMLKGVIPATAGLSLAVALQFAIPLLKKGWNEKVASFSFSLLVIGACATLSGIFKFSASFLLIGSGTLAALIFPRIWWSIQQTQEQSK
ncbi:chromate transporter [Candidatus Chlorohelix sp.]|uniref:chromate transporter n=1 Tax=Candidatus Chlorohelix sp. TaxID=3139201 RepID=UPI003027A3F7